MTMTKRAVSFCEYQKRITECHAVLNAVQPLKTGYSISIADRAEQDIYHAEMALMDIIRELTAEDCEYLFGGQSIVQLGEHETTQNLFSLTFGCGTMLEFTCREHLDNFIVVWSSRNK